VTPVYLPRRPETAEVQALALPDVSPEAEQLAERLRRIVVAYCPPPQTEEPTQEFVDVMVALAMLSAAVIAHTIDYEAWPMFEAMLEASVHAHAHGDALNQCPAGRA
jgi:hypothetical protein